MAERSRAGTSRAFNELFWFHSYPQMTLNQVRKVMENLAEDVKNRNTRQIRANSRLLARLLAGRTLQGAITAGIYALIFGGVFGLATKKKEAQDEFGKFLLDSYIGGLGGPAAIGKRMLEQGGDSKTLAANVAGISTPVSLAGEFLDMRMGNGKYEGRDWFEKIGMFVEGKTPAWRMFKTGLALHGLAEGNPKLDAAKKAFYRWKRELPGRQTTSSSGEPTEEDAAFTAQIRRVIDKLEKGGDWRTELKQVAEKDKSKSLFAKTILRDNNGAGLSEEQIGQLEQRIGKEAVSLLKARDAMVRQLARELGEKEGDVSAVSQPTGTLAVDTMSQGKRIERLENALPTDIREWLTKNELRLTDVSPERKEGPDRVLVKNEDYLKLEAEVVKEYEEGIRQLMDNPSFASASRKEKQERLNRRLSLAERRAKNLTR